MISERLAATIYFLMKTTWLFLTKLQKILDTTQALGVRHLTHENIAGGVDAAFGISIEHG